MIAILLIAVALIAIALILFWGLRSIHSWQAEIASALRALAYSLESAEQCEERLLRLAEQDLMAPQQKTYEEPAAGGRTAGQYEASLAARASAEKPGVKCTSGN